MDDQGSILAGSRVGFAPVAAPEPTVHITLLGQFAIHTSAEPIYRLRTRKTELLLAYLAINLGQVFTREHLIELFWPEEAETNGRQKLRLALTSVRSVLPSELFADRQNVWLANVSVDYFSVEAEGTLLPGYDAEWIVEKQALLEQRQFESLSRQAKLAIETGDTALATDSLLKDSKVNLLSNTVRQQLIDQLAESDSQRSLHIFAPDQRKKRVSQNLRFVNVPAPAGKIFGRDHDLHAVAKLILGDDEPIGVTIMALSGAGKSRLAIELCSLAALDDFDVVWVSLEQIDDITLALLQIKSALLPKSNDSDFDTDLQDLPSTVLVLDNVEQFDQSKLAALIDSLLVPGCSLHIVSTSHGPIGFSGENTYALKPLSVPATNRNDIEENPSVRLFLQRMRQSRPAFEPSEIDLGHIATICRAMSGLPLAIEIVAATAAVRSLRELSENIESEIPTLQQFDPTAKAAHLKLRGVIEWSYDQLSLEAQTFLGRLSSLAGSQPDWILKTLAEESTKLIQECLDHGLLMAEDGQRCAIIGPARPIIQLLRPTAAIEGFELAMEEFLKFTSLLATDAYGEVTKECSRQVSNIEGFLKAKISTGEWPSAMRFVKALYFAHHRNGQVTASRASLENYLHQLPENALHERAEALSLIGHVCYFLTLLPEAEKAYQAAFDLATQTGQEQVRKTCRSNLGLVAFALERYQHSIEILSESISELTDKDPMRRRLTLLLNLGEAFYGNNQFDKAMNCVEQVLALTDEESNLQIFRGMACQNAARMHMDRHEFAMSESWLRRAKTIFESEGEMVRVRQAALLQIEMSIHRGDPLKLGELIVDVPNRELRELPPTLWLALAQTAFAIEAWQDAYIFVLHFESFLVSHRAWLYPNEKLRFVNIKQSSREKLSEETFKSIEQAARTMSFSEFCDHARNLVKRL